MSNHQRIPPRGDRGPLPEPEPEPTALEREREECEECEERDECDEREGISRRDLLRAGVGASLATPLAGAIVPAAATTTLAATTPALAAQVAAPAAATSAGLFFTTAELGLLDELSEMILPADEQSGGARAAGVAAYLDRTLAEKDPRIEEYTAERQRFKQGLTRVDELARAMHGATFLEATPAQRLAVLERMAINEAAPQKQEERFFVDLKRATASAYYSSRVGMIDDLEYKGNRVIREFAGTDVSKG